MEYCVSWHLLRAAPLPPARYGELLFASRIHPALIYAASSAGQFALLQDRPALPTLLLKIGRNMDPVLGGVPASGSGWE